MEDKRIFDDEDSCYERLAIASEFIVSKSMDVTYGSGNEIISNRFGIVGEKALTSPVYLYDAPELIEKFGNNGFSDGNYFFISFDLFKKLTEMEADLYVEDNIPKLLPLEAYILTFLGQGIDSSINFKDVFSKISSPLGEEIALRDDIAPNFVLCEDFINTLKEGGLIKPLNSLYPSLSKKEYLSWGQQENFLLNKWLKDYKSGGFQECARDTNINMLISSARIKEEPQLDFSMRKSFTQAVRDLYEGGSFEDFEKSGGSTISEDGGLSKGARLDAIYIIDCMNNIIKGKNIDKSHPNFNEEVSKFARLALYLFDTTMLGRSIDKFKKSFLISATPQKEDIADIFYKTNGLTKEKREMLIEELSGSNNFDFVYTFSFKRFHRNLCINKKRAFKA